jgi:hypothetical protein
MQLTDIFTCPQGGGRRATGGQEATVFYVSALRPPRRGLCSACGNLILYQGDATRCLACVEIVRRRLDVCHGGEGKTALNQQRTISTHIHTFAPLAGFEAPNPKLISLELRSLELGAYLS